MSNEFVFQLLLLLAVIFGVGFASGFAVRAYISRQHRKRARAQELGAMASEFEMVSDAPQLSPLSPDRIAKSPQSKVVPGSATRSTR